VEEESGDDGLRKDGRWMTPSYRSSEKAHKKIKNSSNDRSGDEPCSRLSEASGTVERKGEREREWAEI
jgi:hypothetical protein